MKRLFSSIGSDILGRLAAEQHDLVGVFGLDPAEAAPPRPPQDIDLLVVYHPETSPATSSYLFRDGLHVHLHGRRHALGTSAPDLASLTPADLARLAAHEYPWELRAGTVLHDPGGSLARTRSQLKPLLDQPEARRARLSKTVERLRTAQMRSTRLAAKSRALERCAHSLRLARRIFALHDPHERNGLIALALRALAQIDGQHGFGWTLWPRARAASEKLRLSPDPLRQITAAHGLPPNAAVPPAPPARAGSNRGNPARAGGPGATAINLTTAQRAIEHARSAAGCLKGPTTAANQTIDRCERLATAGDPGAALVLLRGLTARWFGQHPAYLAICGLQNPNRNASGPDDLAVVWPALLQSLSSTLVGVQSTLKAADGV